jgi:hypothetical protein
MLFAVYLKFHVFFDEPIGFHRFLEHHFFIECIAQIQYRAVQRKLRRRNTHPLRHGLADVFHLAQFVHHYHITGRRA